MKKFIKPKPKIEKIKCALVYDFDGTLAEGDCAEYGIMPELGLTKEKFWPEVKQRAKLDNGDEILSYLGLLSEKAINKKSNILSKNKLREHGKSIQLFPGVNDWFEKINNFAEKNNLSLEHYIVSSGLEEMIAGTPIGNKFRQIYACKYHYSDDGDTAIWPAQAVNYTTKTQFLFRINKGIHNSWDNIAVNKFTDPDERPIPFERMIYFGDGDTDIPSMKMVKLQGGFSIAVFDQKKWADENTQSKIEKLIAEERASYVVPANYQEHDQLFVTVRGLLKLMARKKHNK